MSDEAGDPASPDGAAEDRVVIASSAGASDLLTRGGKVDPDAVRAAVERAQAAMTEEDRDDGEASSAWPVVEFTLQRDLRARLDRYLTSRVTFMSRNRLQRLITEGGVTVNGRGSKPSQSLRLGDVVRVTVPPPPTGEIKPEAIPIEALYEDEHLIVVNKRPDIIVHPARSENSGTLIHALAWHFKHASKSGGALSDVGKEHARPGVVHRLDRHTSGCIVVAKTEEAHWRLGRQFEERTVDKRYLAVVHGAYEPDVDVIELPIGPHRSREKGYREKQVIRHDDLGKRAITIARVRERYRLHDRAVGDQAFSLVELELKTGRTHQIRVHLSHRGFPIVGDEMYGVRAFLDGDAAVIDRQALHAGLLAFEHPVTGASSVFTAPIPADIRALIARLRSGAVDTPPVEGVVPLHRFGIG
ncbi:MAG: RluA family pseudouridine synthase [Planctomycetota bacterium]